METLNIFIKRKSDTTPSFDDINKDNYAGEAKIKRVAILEKGTIEGKAALGFDIELPDGKHVIAQLTENIFEALGASLKGAKLHWQANPQ